MTKRNNARSLDAIAEDINKLELRAKPVERFVGRFSQAQLHEVADFLRAVAEADQKVAA
jgi:hypothetical protein